MRSMDIFDALADPTRRKIVELLADSGPLPASEICDHFPVSRPAISQHLKALRLAGLVEMEKQAQQRIYRLNPQAVQHLESWAKGLTQVWSQRYQALDALLELEKKKL